MGHALNNTLQDILAASSACAAATCCGSRAPTMPASPPRWWSSASSWSARSPTAARSAARSSSRRCGPGRRSRAAPSSTSSSGSAPPATGRASASPWTKGSRAPCCKVFVELYRAGLIYKDKRLVNWDPKLLTAISDLEVQQVEVKGISGTSTTRLENAADGFHHRRHHAAGDHAGRHRGRGASGRRALPPPDRQTRGPAAGRPPHPDHRRRHIPIRRRAPARSRSRRRTTSTISRSAAGTCCR